MNKVLKNSKILVTGARGGLGKVVISTLRSRGYSMILAPSRNDLNLLDADSVSRYIGQHQPDAVVHLAALVFGLQGNLDNQLRSLLENSQINQNIFSALFIHPVDYFFFASTVAAYAYPYKRIPLVEEDFFGGLPHGGEFGYAMSKRHAYAYLKILKDTKCTNFTYGIFTNLYGENDRFDDTAGHVIPSLITKANRASLEKKPLFVWGDGTAERDFLHFDDAAQAILRCVEMGTTPELINISSGRSTSVRMLAELVCKTAGVADLEFEIVKPVGIQSRVVDNTLLRNLGFSQSIDLDFGIQRLYRWYSENMSEVRR